MSNLTERQLNEIFVVGEFEHMGGSVPFTYQEYRLREALRTRRLLKFSGRRNVRWDRTFYDITDAGRDALALSRAERSGGTE